jgi:hypothetical protein
VKNSKLLYNLMLFFLLMDENKIKEQLSRCFIKAIGYHQCCNFSEDENDYGTDLTIKEMTTRTEN